MSRRLTLAAVLVITLLSHGLPAQQGSALPPAPPQRAPVFRSDANFVLVDAYPMKDGKVVTNLEKGDFDIFEDGKPQKVESFELVKVEPFTPENEKRDPNTQEEGNELAADPKNRVFVIYLDALNVSVEGAHAARQPLVQMLNRIMSPTDLFGVMSPDMRPRDLVFGRKVQTTEDMLTKYWPWGQRNSILRTPQEGAMEQCTIDPKTGKPFYVMEGAAQRRMMDVLVDRSREDRVLTHLEDLVTYLGGIRETRISLVVFTEGWLQYEPDVTLEAPLANIINAGGGIPNIRLGPTSPGAMAASQYGSTSGCVLEVQRLARLSDRSRFRQLIDRAGRANVVFYPVNPGGLQVFDYPINQEVYAPDPRQSVGLQSQRRVQQRVDTMIDAATNTGGMAVVNTNDLNAGLDRLASQLSAYYVLGYYSTNSKFDGRFRKIDVKLKVPGLKVTARKGYRAPTEAEMAPRNAPKPVVDVAVDTEKAAMADALGSLARIRAGADLYGWGLATKSGEVTVVAEVSASLAEAGKWMNGADLQVTVTTPAGEQLTTARVRLAASTRSTVVKVAVPAGPGPWHAQLRLKNGDDILETTAVVPALPANGTSSLLSAPSVYRAAPGPRSPLAPVADFLFRRTERVHVEWQVSSATDAREARLLDRSGNALPLQVTVAEKDGVLAADVNLAPLGPGDYVIELKVASGPQNAKVKLAIRVQS